MGNTVAKLNEVNVDGLSMVELSELLKKTQLKVNVLEKKLKLMDEISLEYKEKLDITEIESYELVKELLYRKNVNKVVLDDLENLDTDYLLENLEFSEEYLVIPIFN